MNSKLYNLIEKYPNNIEKIYNSKVFDEIKLYNRENRLLYSQKGTPNKNLKEVLDMEWHASDEEIENTRNEMDKIIGNISKNLKKRTQKNKEKDFER